jgi:hypothetical protein
MPMHERSSRMHLAKFILALKLSESRGIREIGAGLAAAGLTGQVSPFKFDVTKSLALIFF